LDHKASVFFYALSSFVRERIATKNTPSLFGRPGNLFYNVVIRKRNVARGIENAPLRLVQD